MADVNKPITSPEGVDPTQLEGIDNTNNNPGDDIQTELPTTLEELQALLQKEGDKRVSQAQKKWQEKQKEVIEQEKEEAARLAKMSAAEREKAKFEKEKAEFEAERAKMARQQLEIQTGKELMNEGLSAEFTRYVMADNAEAINENIKEFKKLWTASLEKGIAERIATPTPKKGTSSLNKKSSNLMDAINSKKIRK